MKKTNYSMCVIGGCVFIFTVGMVSAQDWPQWRGPNRDAKAAGFKAPATWPKNLSPKWKVAVGEGVASPSLMGDKLYVFSRFEGSEIIRCLDAVTGKELWQDKYESAGATGPASGFSGPRSTPTVSNGKVITLGVTGTISCLDAASGKVLWRKDEFKAFPRFHPSSSPLVANGLCIAQLGGQANGALVAYDLSSGEQKWKAEGDSPGYASPVLMNVGGISLVFAETEKRLIAVNIQDGKLMWEMPYAVQGRGYNASTPIVEGQTLYFSGSGRGTRAISFAKSGDKITGTDLWNNAEKSVQFNTPVLKDGKLYGLTQGSEFYCLDAKDGKAIWGAPVSKPAEGQPAAAAPAGGDAQRPGGGMGGPGGGGRGGRGGGMGGGGGYGSLVDAGSVLLALTPASELIVFKPGDTYNEVARIKVSETQTHAYPIASGNRIFLKDRDSVMLVTLD